MSAIRPMVELIKTKILYIDSADTDLTKFKLANQEVGEVMIMGNIRTYGLQSYTRTVKTADQKF